MNIKWSDEEIARLKELREQCLSAREMARELSCTRNGIIGKLRRLGLSPISERPNGGGGRKRNREPDIALPAVAPSDRPGAVTALKKWSRLPRTRLKAPSQVSLGPVTIWNVNEGQCRWPNDGSVALEGSRENTFRFCGDEAIKGSSYCHLHAGLAAPQ